MRSFMWPALVAPLLIAFCLAVSFWDSSSCEEEIKRLVRGFRKEEEDAKGKDPYQS